MSTFFMFCALVGGTFLACQLVMTLIGIGHGDIDTDLGHVSIDHPSIDVPAPDGDVAHGLPSSEAVSHASDRQGHSSSWLFGIISLRTIVAAATFFGLAGMTAHSGGAPLYIQLIAAIVCGGLAMLGVHALMRLLYRLGQTGTLQLTNAIGKTATVSVSIPGGRAGQGKVRLTVQGRLEELAAVALTGEALRTGSQVIVVDVIHGNVLEVAPLRETN